MYKNILVTGASAGFGKAICETLSADGYNVIACARRFDRLAALKSKGQGRIYPLALDVTDPGSVQAALASLPEEFKSIDVLINNAGLALGTDKAQDCDLEDWNTMIDTNIKGLILMTRLLMPKMVERNFGYIINLGSTAGAWPYTGGNVYCGTKAFVEQFSRTLRCDLAGTAVKVSVVKPGLCSDTEFSNVRYHGDNDKARAVYEGTESIKPADVASVVQYLVNTPSHVNINEIEMMPVCQTYGGLCVTRNLKLD